MNATKAQGFLLVCTCILVLAAGGFAFRARVAARNATAEQQSLDARRSELHQRMRAAEERRMKAAEAALDVTTAGRVDQRGADTLGAASREVSAQEQRERRERNPDLQNRYFPLRKERRIAVFRPFFRAIKLSAEEIDRLGEAWVQRDMLASDLSGIRKERNLPAQDAGLDALRKKAAEEVRAVEEAVLGPAGVVALRQWGWNQQARDVVTKFAGKAALAGIPISPKIGEQMVAALAVADPEFQKSSTYRFEKMRWEEAQAAARALLSPAQYELFMIESECSRSSAAFTKALTEAKRLADQRAAKPAVRDAE